MSALKNPAHETFAREVAGGNSLRLAWLAAGFSEGSRNWARLARKGTVARRVEELRCELNASAAVHLRYVQEKLLAIIGADVTAYLEKSKWGDLRIRDDLHNLPAELRLAISELKIDKDRRVSLKLESKSHAIDALLKTIPGGSSGEAGANIQVNQIARLIIEPQLVPAQPVVSEQPGQVPSPAERVAACMRELGLPAIRRT